MLWIATLVVVVQALMKVLMYVMGWGQVVSRAGGKGSPIDHVFMVPTVMMTRKFVNGKKLTKLCAKVMEESKTGIGVLINPAWGLIGHNVNSRMLVPTVVMTWKLVSSIELT